MEWRIVYVQKPMNHNPRHVEFVEAATKEEAAAIARDRIERRTGIAFNAHLGWAFEGITEVEPVQAAPNDDCDRDCCDDELSYARVKDGSIDDAWGVFKYGELIAVVDTETMAARLCAAEEMLTALKAVRSALWEHGARTGDVIWVGPPFQYDCVHESAIERIDAAIAKATISEKSA